jgi:hypothetical protein
MWLTATIIVLAQLNPCSSWVDHGETQLQLRDRWVSLRSPQPTRGRKDDQGLVDLTECQHLGSITPAKSHSRQFKEFSYETKEANHAIS